MPDAGAPNISQTFADVIPFAVSAIIFTIFDIIFRNVTGICFAQGVIEFFQPLFTAADGYIGLAIIYGACHYSGLWEFKVHQSWNRQFRQSIM